MMIVLPRATDSQGRVYFRPLGGMRPGGGTPDSAAVVRWDRGTGAMDTVAMVKLEDRKVTSGGSGNNRTQMVRPVPYSPQDGWAAGWNGRIAAARSGPYYLEWVDMAGAGARSADVQFSPVRIREADKEEYIDRAQASGLSVMMTVGRASCAALMPDWLSDAERASKPAALRMEVTSLHESGSGSMTRIGGFCTPSLPKYVQRSFAQAECQIGPSDVQ